MFTWILIRGFALRSRVLPSFAYLECHYALQPFQKST